MKHQYAICGAGIAGLTTAIALNQIGIYPHIYEAAPTLAPVGAGLGLAANAMKAFQMLGIGQEVISKGRFLDALNIYDHHGNLLNHTDSRKFSQKYGQDNFCIHRADLHQLLISYIDPEFIHTGKQLKQLEINGQSQRLYFADGTRQETDYLIAADGINSVIRQHLLPGITPRYSGYTCWRAVIPDVTDYQEAAEYWGPAGRFGMVPLPGNRLYWFCCINSGPDESTMKTMTSEMLQARFSNYPKPVRMALKNASDAKLIWGDIQDLPPLKQFSFGNIVLIGDAAHATTPNMGQGACQAIEDAVILAQEMEKTNNPATAFKSFEKRRIKRTHEIIRNSEMIGKVAQLENPYLIIIRNLLMKNLPKNFNEQQLLKLYKVDF